MTRSDYQREQRQMRRRIRELLAQRRSDPADVAPAGADHPAGQEPPPISESVTAA